MNRDYIIKIVKSFESGNLYSSDALELIKEYCIEMNKPINLINQLIQALSINSIILEMFVPKLLPDALDYFMCKYNICKIYSAPIPPDNIDGNRKLLKIF